MKTISENYREILELLQYLQFLFSDENKSIFDEMRNDDFSYIDVLTLSEEEEKQLKIIYEASLFIENIYTLPDYIKDAFANVKKRLKPLFEDTTTYLLQEPNRNILLESLQQAHEGKLNQIDL